MKAIHLQFLAAALAFASAPLIAQPPPSPPSFAAQKSATPAPAPPILKVFQFPADKIPRIDGDPSDWSIVPDSYTITLAQMHDDEHKHAQPDPKDLDIHVKVGWVKGLNRLYFLYEAYDNYWDFAEPGLHNDTFEIVVDGDRSGGPLVPRFRNNVDTTEDWDAHFSMHGVEAQNYHIFTPSEGKDWAMAWGCQPWDKELPYANHAQHYTFRPGESGKYILEFYITPFDYAGCEGPQRAVESLLTENKIIGLSFAVIDYDGSPDKKNNGFWNLSSEHTMYGQANFLREFQLMPLEPALRKPIDAKWTFKVLDVKRRLVAFQDQSEGDIKTWRWDFGDGTTSTDPSPIHAYKSSGEYTVVLYIEGPAGKSRLSKVWDVSLR
jgi:PKD domain